MIRGAAIALIVATASVAAADEASEIARDGFAAYDRADYAAAIAFFERANEIAPAPGLLFNIAQSYRQLGTSGCGPALEYYGRYLDALETSGGAVPESVRARIVEMRECVDAAVEREPAPASIEPVAVRPATATPMWTAPRSDPPPRSSRRRTGWIIAGIGAAALTAAAITGALALERESSLSATCSDGVCPPVLESEVAGYDRLRYTAFASGAVGAAAVIAGAVLIVSGGSTDRDTAVARASSAVVIGQRSVGVRCDF